MILEPLQPNPFDPVAEWDNSNVDVLKQLQTFKERWESQVGMVPKYMLLGPFFATWYRRAHKRLHRKRMLQRSGGKH